METTLFLLCPTDCLESKINEEFKGDNLFYSSLANNSSFDSKTIRDIEELVNRYSIKEVYFVLSKQLNLYPDTSHLLKFDLLLAYYDDNKNYA